LSGAAAPRIASGLQGAQFTQLLRIQMLLDQIGQALDE
jgi:hypothetical protein